MLKLVILVIKCKKNTFFLMFLLDLNPKVLDYFTGPVWQIEIGLSIPHVRE